MDFEVKGDLVVRGRLLSIQPEAPESGQASVTISNHGVTGQADNSTHFGYTTDDGPGINYIRGNNTVISSPVKFERSAIFSGDIDVRNLTVNGDNLDIDGTLTARGPVNLLGSVTGLIDYDRPSQYADFKGGFQIRWGSGVSNIDTTQTFSFSRPFSADCQSIIITRSVTDSQSPLPATSCSRGSFTINRDDNIDGDNSFYYIAIGY